LLTKGIHAEEILEYGWYLEFVAHVIWASSLHFLHLLLVFSLQIFQPIQSLFPLACINSLNFFKCPLWDFVCVCTATQLTVFFHQWLFIQNDLDEMCHYHNFFAHFSYVMRSTVG
jgi:hypothetical protein